MSIRKGLRGQELLGDAIQRQLKLTARPMPGFYQKSRLDVKHFLMMAAYWTVILGILAVFFALESNVSQVDTGWISKLLLILLMAAEVGTIYLWTALTG